MESREDDGQEKTEEPTEEKRKQFREQGNVANPKEILQGISLLSFAIAMYFTGSILGNDLLLLFHKSWVSLKPHQLTSQNIFQTIFEIIKPILWFLFFLGCAQCVIPVITGLGLTKFNWSWQKMEPKLSKLNPFSGLKRMVSMQGLQELLKSIAKVCILGFIAFLIIQSSIESSVINMQRPPQSVLHNLGFIVFELMFYVALGGMSIGIADYTWNWFQVEKKMKMTKQQLKDDLKKQEGDPMVKGQRKRMAREFIIQRSLQEVPKATFVVTNPEHFAVAILYQTGMPAPIVVAKGMDFLALKIKDIAKNNDIAIVENKPLARTLYKTTDIGKEVPDSLYSAIIEVMKYIYQTKGSQYFNAHKILGQK